MYFGFFGGSALLHLLAAHPKVVAALGVATTVSLLLSPVGPGNYLGAGQQMRRLNQAVVARELVDDQAVVAAERRTATRSAAVEQSVRDVLRACGQGCADLTPNIVLNDPTLLERALYVSALDRRALERSAAGPSIAEFLAQR